MIAGLDHITINTANISATERFYTDVVGLELAPRPDLGVPGIWLKATGESAAIVHVLEVEEQTLKTEEGRPTIDHIAFHAQNYPQVMGKLLAEELPWRGNIIASFGLWQLMFYDPNGALIEMNFKASAENCETPVIPHENQLTQSAFFEPNSYKNL